MMFLGGCHDGRPQLDRHGPTRKIIIHFIVGWNIHHDESILLRWRKRENMSVAVSLEKIKLKKRIPHFDERQRIATTHFQRLMTLHASRFKSSIYVMRHSNVLTVVCWFYIVQGVSLTLLVKAESNCSEIYFVIVLSISDVTTTTANCWWHTGRGRR